MNEFYGRLKANQQQGQAGSASWRFALGQDCEVRCDSRTTGVVVKLAQQ
ncbi:Uncharacterized protein ChrSV_2521 [Chromobacterium vaccinii]|nr:Uncharacterized protein ChrSW_2521 [Chromobacterium vaccinii]QND89978.1 Uncharacterized protein ChrSV_2521 [Chromobacterium vaccinii]